MVELCNEGGKAGGGEQARKRRCYAAQHRQHCARRAHPDELGVLVHWSVRPRGCFGSLEGGEDRACLDGARFVDTAGDEAVERFAHRAHRADLAFELPLLLDRALADVPAASDTLRYYEREGLIEPAGKSPAGYRLYDRDSARRLRPDARGGGELADGEHGAVSTVSLDLGGKTKVKPGQAGDPT